jgi:hypothetical protein
MPQLQNEAVNPAGIAPADLAAMNTAAQQSGGGAAAGTVGQGGLLSARTRNAGGPANAIASGVRTAGQQASNAALGVQNENTQAKLHQQQAGLGGLENLYGQNLGGSINALGEVAPNINANTQAANSSWDWANSLLGPILKAGAGAINPLFQNSGSSNGSDDEADGEGN